MHTTEHTSEIRAMVSIASSATANVMFVPCDGVYVSNIKPSAASLAAPRDVADENLFWAPLCKACRLENTYCPLNQRTYAQFSSVAIVTTTCTNKRV